MKYTKNHRKTVDNFPEETKTLRGHTSQSFDVLQIGIKRTPDELKKAIYIRLQKRIKGIIKEVRKLNKNSLSIRRLEELGLEYRYAAQYLQDKISYEEMETKLEKEIWQFSKRQMTWFKRDTRIHWVKTQKQAENLIKDFIKKECPTSEEIKH